MYGLHGEILISFRYYSIHDKSESEIFNEIDKLQALYVFILISYRGLKARLYHGLCQNVTFHRDNVTMSDNAINTFGNVKLVCFRLNVNYLRWDTERDEQFLSNIRL